MTDNYRNGRNSGSPNSIGVSFPRSYFLTLLANFWVTRWHCVRKRNADQ